MNKMPGTISFTLFGIPVFIRPVAWIVLALLGGGLHMSSLEALPSILVFVVVGMLVLLTHEFGHALVGRMLGGRPHLIVVEGLGAFTHSNPPRGRWGNFMMVLAGPLATLLPGLLAGAVFGVVRGGDPLAGIVLAITAPMPFVDVPLWVGQSLDLFVWSGAVPDAFTLLVCETFFGVSFWWCLFNLLPILPLDGGHLLAILCPSHKVPCVVGMVVSIVLAVLAFTIGSVFLIIFFGYFAYLNWQFLTRGGL